MFYLAISMVGTDFSMMAQLLTNRTRTEIKVHAFLYVKKIKFLKSLKSFNAQLAVDCPLLMLYTLQSITLVLFFLKRCFFYFVAA